MKRITLFPIVRGGNYIRIMITGPIPSNRDVDTVQAFSPKTSLDGALGIGDPWYLFNYEENSIKKIIRL